MDFDTLISMIGDSPVDDWRRVDLTETETNWIYCGVYLPNVAITLRWGETFQEPFEEEWAMGFGDSNAAGRLVDVLFNGALVFRSFYASVDGGRCLLPIPKSREELVVPKRYAGLIYLIHRMSGGVSSDFGDYMERAGIEIIDSPWPQAGFPA